MFGHTNTCIGQFYTHNGMEKVNGFMGKGGLIGVVQYPKR